MKIEYMKGSNVISIAPMRDKLHFPSIKRVEGYWEGLRNGRLMPARGEVDPRGIADVLEYAFVLEKVAPGVARIRLAGMHLNDLMGMEVRGMPITAMFLPESRRALQVHLESVLESPAKITLSLESDHGLTRPRLEAQLVLLPLKDREGRPSRILGALQARGSIGRGPRRFNILSQKVETLLGDMPPIRRDEREKAPREAGFAERQAGFEGSPGTAQGAPHLRLVHDALDE